MHRAFVQGDIETGDIVCVEGGQPMRVVGYDSCGRIMTDTGGFFYLDKLKIIEKQPRPKAAQRKEEAGWE